jgi:hypothetical protein
VAIAEVVATTAATVAAHRATAKTAQGVSTTNQNQKLTKRLLRHHRPMTATWHFNLNKYFLTATRPIGRVVFLCKF